MTTTVNQISLSSQSIYLLDNHTISSAYHGNYGRASMRVIGEDGVIYLKDSWNYASPVYIQRINSRLTRLEERIEKKIGYLYKIPRNSLSISQKT